MRLVYSSSRSKCLDSYSERSSRMAIKWPARPTSRPSTDNESIKFVPLFAMRQFNGPVETAMKFASSCTVTGDLGTTAEPVPTVNGVASVESAAMASPDHFTDPSGQYASGQVCVGRDCPSAVRTTTCDSFAMVPRGHGTPQLTPTGVSGGFAPSQESGTAFAAGVDGFGSAPIACAAASSVQIRRLGFIILLWIHQTRAHQSDNNFLREGFERDAFQRGVRSQTLIQQNRATVVTQLNRCRRNFRQGEAIKLVVIVRSAEAAERPKIQRRHQFQ